MPKYTNLGWWALSCAANGGLKDTPEVELGGLDQGGNYTATFVLPAYAEFDACKLIMSLTRHLPQEVGVSKDAESIRVRTTYPTYMGEPNAEHFPY